MSVIGEAVKVVAASDPSKVGVEGVAVLETANMVLIRQEGRNLAIEKAGSVLVVQRTGVEVEGSRLAGRPEDRLGSKR